MKKIFIILLLITFSLKSQKTLYSYEESGFKLLDKIFDRKTDRDDENKQYVGASSWLIKYTNKINPFDFLKLIKYFCDEENTLVSINPNPFENFKKNCPKLKTAFHVKDNPKDCTIRPQIDYSLKENKYQPTFRIKENKKRDLININNKSKLYCIGDIHGNISSFIKIINYFLINKILLPNLKLQKDSFLIFQGDYTDREAYGTEILFIIFILKIFNPENVFLIRGNHEEILYQVNQKNADKTFVQELSEKFLSSETKHIPTVLLNYLEIAYASMPYIAQVNNTNTDKKLIICHGDEKSYWHDVFPEFMFEENVKKVPSFRGEGVKIKNAKHVAEELRRNGYSMMIKAHDHSMPKFITLDKAPEIEKFKSKTPATKKYLESIPIEYLEKETSGAVNIGTKEFPIIVNMAGPVGGANYFPTTVKITPDEKANSGWNYEVINCKFR